MPDAPPPARLRRVLSLPVLALYGLGTTIGAGIYALVGEVAGMAGTAAPLSYLLAAILAGLTALAYAEMAARVPRAAGEAAYVQAAFGSRGLATLVGLLVATAACVSAATVTNGFVGYASALIPLPAAAGVIGLAGGLGLVAAWGIRESAWAAAVMTLVEIGGLVVVIVAGGTALGELPLRLETVLPPGDRHALKHMLSAVLLAFYAFTGFEDMANVAEEVRDVRRSLPIAIAATFAVTLLLYLLIATVAVLLVPPAELMASPAPLTLVYERAGGALPALLTLIGVLSMVNGALVQLVKGARVLYGLADAGALPAALAAVHPRTRTPVRATLLVTLAIIVLALAFPLARLAETTAAVTLVVFALVDAGLVRLKRREPPGARGPLPFTVPLGVPLLGCLASLAVLAFELVARLG